MKKIKVFAIAIVACLLLTGCNFRIITDKLIFGNGYDQETADNEITFAGETFEIVDEKNEGVSIEKPDSQKGEGDKITSAGQAYNSVSEVYYAVADSVVEITTETVQMSGWGQYVASGAGSGVIIDASGLIVTNYHVIASATSIVVRLTSGEEFAAAVVGYDESDTFDNP